MRVLTVLLIVVSWLGVAVTPVFGQGSTGDEIDRVQIQFTGPLTYEDVTGDGYVDVVIGGVVVVPPWGFDSNLHPVGELIMVTGYLNADDTVEATEFVPADAVTELPELDSDEEAGDDLEEDEEVDDRGREEGRGNEGAGRGGDDRDVVEISGVITEVTQNTIVVDEVEVEGGGVFRPSRMEVGQMVTITGMYENNGRLRAMTIVQMSGEADEATDTDDIESEIVDLCIPVTHPVVQVFMDEFDAELAMIINLYCAGNGFGDLARAFMLSEETGTAPENYLELLNRGQDWGSIMRGVSLEPGALSPDRVLGH